MARSFKEVARLRESDESRRKYEENYAAIFGKKDVLKISSEQTKELGQLQEEYLKIEVNSEDIEYDDAAEAIKHLDKLLKICRKYEVKQSDT
jgi:predicted GTPase